jgi:hypothetical protein
MTTQSTPRSPTAAELLRLAISGALEDVHVAIPGRIEEWDATTQKASVKPLIKRLIAADDGSEILEELPIITDVPVVFPRSSEFFVSFPMTKGDLVLLIFCERSIDVWLSGNGDDTNPDDFRRHDLSDAIAIPGMYPFKKAISQVDKDNMVLGKDKGIQIHLTPDGTVEAKMGGGTAGLSAAIAEKLETLYTSVKMAFDNHTHGTGVGPSGPPVPLPTFPSWDATIASEKVKVED